MLVLIVNFLNGGVDLPIWVDLLKLWHLDLLRIHWISWYLLHCEVMSDLKFETAAPFWLRSQLHKVGDHTSIMTEDLLFNSGTRQSHVGFLTFFKDVLSDYLNFERAHLLRSDEDLQQDWAWSMAWSPLPSHKGCSFFFSVQLFMLKVFELSVRDECVVLGAHESLR